MYDENGNLSDAGTASMGLHAESYGVYMAQADKYADEIKKINKELASDPNNKDLIARRDELLSSQRDSILAAKDEKEAMIDLAKNGIQVELDAVRELIDAYTDSLDSAKDLYDYQKKIAEKTANISALEKQLAAYQNDMSEETRSKIQKIQLELKDAQDDLKDTEYDRFVSDATLIVTCKQDCDFTIINESEGCSSVIKNCKAGEQIILYGDTNVIASSYSGHDVCNDFNYDFFRIGNSATRMENVITVSHPCDIILKYHPIIKYAQL